MDSGADTTLPSFADFNRRTLLGILFTGLVTAVITVLAAFLLNDFIISPALCRGAGETACSASSSVSFHISSIIAAIVAVALLVNLSVYRPLLVVLAVVIGSWGIYNAPLPFIHVAWFWQLGILLLINSVALLAFSWILRIYNLTLALIATVVLMGAMIAVINL